MITVPHARFFSILQILRGWAPPQRTNVGALEGLSQMQKNTTKRSRAVFSSPQISLCNRYASRCGD